MTAKGSFYGECGAEKLSKDQGEDVPLDRGVRLPRKEEGSWKGKSKQKGYRKPPLTHFLCVPLVNNTSRPSLSNALDQLRKDVCGAIGAQHGEANADNGRESSVTVPAEAVRPLGTLHLTLGVMSLRNEEKIERAIAFLENLNLSELFQRVSSNDSSTREPVSSQTNSSMADAITINLRSLAAMHSPRRTSVLYAVPEEASSSPLLYDFFNCVRSAFMEAGLVLLDERPLKLHATIINTIYARSGGRDSLSKRPRTEQSQTKETGSNKAEDAPAVYVQTHKSRNRHSHGPIQLDVRSLLENYKDFVWADGIKLEKIAICKMGANKILNNTGEIVDEQYVEIASKDMPGFG